MKIPLTVIALILSAAAMPVRAQNPCAGVDRSLPQARAKKLGPRVAKQLDATKADISRSFRFGGWTVLYVSTPNADDAFVFYRGDPMRSKYVTLWGGAAREDEEGEIQSWTLKNASGIPHHLADCFAWYVTH